MADKTSIEWTDASLNPVLARNPTTGKLGFHCEKVSPGCKNCYAETFNVRRLPARGTGLKYTRQATKTVDTVLHQPALDQLLRWTRPRRVFMCSMTDLFGAFVPPRVTEAVLTASAKAAEKGHTIQILTKRPALMKVEVTRWAEKNGRPLPKGVWLGVSAEDQQRLDERAPLLLTIPKTAAAGVRWLSYEPALGPLDLTGHLPEAFTGYPGDGPGIDGLDWLVAGGESGAGARPCDIGWFLDVRDQCEAADVPFFMKQFGRRPHWPQDPEECELDYLDLHHHKGGDMSEWPLVSLQIRMFPGDAWVDVYGGER